MATHLLHVLLQLSLLVRCLASPGTSSLVLARRLDQLQADREADRAELRALEEELVALRGAPHRRGLKTANHSNSTVAKWCDCEKVTREIFNLDYSEYTCPSGGFVVNVYLMLREGAAHHIASVTCCSPCFGDQGARVCDLDRLKAMTSGFSHPRKLFPMLMVCLAAGIALAS